jgi:hypothetical protein
MYMCIDSTSGYNQLFTCDDLFGNAATVSVGGAYQSRQRQQPSGALTSVDDPTIIFSVTPSMISGLPALPIPTILPFFTPMSAFQDPERRGQRSKESAGGRP